MNGELHPNFLTSIGSLSQAHNLVPPPPSRGVPFHSFPKSEEYNLTTKISEDVINQALFAASMVGLLDIDIEPNFFTNKFTDNEIGFVGIFLPTVAGIFGTNVFIDLNKNGFNDDAN